MAEAQEEEEHQTMTEPPYPFSSFLRRGLRIGRRVAIAGAAMAAAPVLIPTIVMGAAFSFPFGVYLAGFAFTDRVMRSLLSISSSQNIGISEMGKVGILKKNEEDLDPIINYHHFEDHREQEEVECDEPTLTTAEHKISMWTDMPIEEGNSFGGTGIGGETHVEEATDRDLDNCDPEQVTKINFMHASSTGNKEDTFENIGMEEKERQTQAEIRAEENEERGERDKTDKENTNEKLKIWSLDNSPNGCTNTKGVGKPIEATEKAEKDEMKEEMEIQGLSTVVSEVKECPMTSHPFAFVMSKGNNDEKDLTIFSSKQPAADKGDEMRVEEVKQPEIILEGRYRGEEDKEQDVNEEKLNREEGSYVFATLSASVEGESVVKQPSAEWSRYEGVEILGSTMALGIVVEAAMRQRNAEDSGSALIPHIEDMTVCHSSVSAVPLPCENEMAPSSLWKEYACVVEDYSSDRTGVESGPPSTVVEIAGVVYFHDEDPRVQEEVERDKPALVTAVNEIEIYPRTIKLNTPREERGNTDGMRISEERCIEEVGASELNYHDIEQDNKISFKLASSIDSIIPDIGMVDGTTNAEVGFENNEDAEGIEEMEDEKAGVNEEQRIGCSDYPSNVNDYRRGFISMETGDRAAEFPGNGTVDEKKAEQEMKIESLTAAVPEVKHHPEMTSPFAAVMPDTETEGRILSSSSSFVVEKGNERRMQEVKQPELMFHGRGGRIEDEVHDAPSAAVETKEVLPTVRRSLTAVPEEWEIDFKLPGLGSVHAFSAVTNKEVEGKPMKEANEKVREQEDMDRTHTNYVVTSVVSVECKSVVEQFSVEQNIIDKNVEDGICVATASIEQTGVRHSFVDAVLLENESEMAPSSLSTEYASAVEDHSSYVTDAESAPAVTVSETAGIVLFHDEESYNEETIWQQICAMRTIVGYDATPHSSLVDELKALYLFTGVEPPISLSETSDVVEMSDKLKLLKSVVGVE